MSVSGTEAAMLSTKADGMTVEGYYTSGLIGSTFKGINVSFAESGTYEVTVLYKANVSVKYLFNVSENAVVPGYKADITAEEADNFKVVISRADQYGSGINAEIVVELADKEGVVATLTADDYYLYTLVNGEEVKLDNLFFDYFMPVNYEFYVKITNPEYVAASTLNVVGKISFVAPDYNGQLICESELTDKTTAYSLTIGDTAIRSTQSSYAGYVFNISPICPADKVVKGVTFNHEIKLTVDNEEITLASGEYKFASFDAEKGTYGFGSFSFSEEGKYSGKQLCLIVTDAEIVDKIEAASSVSIGYKVFAKNYNNVLLADANALVTVQASSTGIG